MAISSGPKIGLDSVYVAALSADSSTVAPTWGTPVLLAGAAKLTGNPNGSVTTDWGDNGPFWVGTTRGTLQAQLELIDVDPDVLALVLGQTRANGITEENAMDQAPYYAIGFRVWIGGTTATKVYEYFWYLKGKFTVPEQGSETKKASFNPQHYTLNAEFARTLYNGVMSTHARSDSASVATSTITNWFSQPVYSSGVDLGALTLTSATASISTKTFTITFAKAGGGTTTILDGSNSNIAIAVGSTGAQIALTTFTPGSASTTPTLAVVTSATLTGVPYSIFVTTSLHDANGVSCVQKVISCTPA